MYGDPVGQLLVCFITMKINMINIEGSLYYIDYII